MCPSADNNGVNYLYTRNLFKDPYTKRRPCGFVYKMTLLHFVYKNEYLTMTDMLWYPASDDHGVQLFVHMMTYPELIYKKTPI